MSVRLLGYVRVETSQLHGIPGLISQPPLPTSNDLMHAHAVGHFTRLFSMLFFIVPKLKTRLKFALMQSAVIGLYLKDTILDDVCVCGGRVFRVVFRC